MDNVFVMFEDSLWDHRLFGVYSTLDKAREQAWKIIGETEGYSFLIYDFIIDTNTWIAREWVKVADNE